MRDRFEMWAADVVEWNSVARDFNEDDYDEELQKSLIKEELKEVKEAIDSGVKEDIIAELCDLFVVSSYLYYKEWGLVFKPTNIYISKDEIKYLESIIKMDDYDHVVFRTAGLLNTYPCEVVDKIMWAKLESNWSKFPSVGQIEEYITKGDLRNTLEKECKSIANSSKGRYTGVTYKVVVGEEVRLIFKADSGKIVKPCTYKGWKKFL